MPVERRVVGEMAIFANHHNQVTAVTHCPIGSSVSLRPTRHPGYSTIVAYNLQLLPFPSTANPISLPCYYQHQTDPVNQPPLTLNDSSSINSTTQTNSNSILRYSCPRNTSTLPNRLPSRIPLSDLMFSLLTSRALSTARVVTVSPFKKQFALSAISETFPPEINVKLAPAHERPLFSYSSNDAAPNTPSTPSTPSTTPSRFEYQIEPMQTSQFLIDCAEQSLIPPPPIPFTHYFTAILTSPAYVSFLRANFSDWRAVLSPHHAPSPAKLSPSIWIGGTGTTTTLHYDVSDNVLTNVLGKKRVRVYSPASHKTFNVFPDSDPRARKAQIPLDEVSGWEALQPIVDVVIEEGVSEAGRPTGGGRSERRASSGQGARRDELANCA